MRTRRDGPLRDRGAGRVTGPLLISAVGVVIAVAAVGWVNSTHPTAIGQIRPGTASSLAHTADQLPGSSPPPAPSIPISGPGGDISPVPARGQAPVRVRIPSLSVDAKVLAEGVDAERRLVIPADIRTVGWYRFGSAPGAASGSVVLVGHVDSAVAGTGVFFLLETIKAGALVTVSTADGRAWRYQVIAREEFPKTHIPLAAIFAPTGPPRLILATCGGPFDRATGSYLDNIVVTAIPIRG